MNVDVVAIDLTTPMPTISLMCRVESASSASDCGGQVDEQAADAFGSEQLRTRFDHFALDLCEDKQSNIAYRNLLQFLGLENDFTAIHPVPGN